MRNLSLAAALLLALAACGEDGGSSDGPIIYPDFGNPNPPKPDLTAGCGPASCTGCCKLTTAGTSCVGGGVDDACGYGGLTCISCSSGQKCNNGVCAGATCDATKCKDGCCDKSGKCVSPPTNNSCGVSGAKCATCQSSETCIKGACKDESKLEYEIILKSVEKVTGYSCDSFGGKCDFYVKLTVGNQTGKSSTKSDTDNATFNETLINSAKALDITKKFEVKVYDEDWPVDQFVGDCKPTITTKDLVAGSLKTECGTYSSMGFLKTSYTTFTFKAK